MQADRPARLLLPSAVMAFVVWFCFTWPLPVHMFDGVPTSSRNVERGSVRAMMPSDQLQVVYYYWLVQDMIAGETPLFHNLYEFNTGDDTERFWPYAYFVPFSLLFAMASAVGGRAFGLNLVGWVSLWLTLYFSWLLARRYCRDRTLAGLAALISILVPFRWAAQLGGSPGGVAMLYVPMLCLGLDVAVRDRRWIGGALAAVAILLVCWGDVQVFLFCGLTMPFWCLLAWAADPPPWRDLPGRFLAWAVALSPVVIGIGLAFGYRKAMHPYLAGSMMSGGRSLSVVAATSPEWFGLFSWQHLGIHNHIYLGAGLLVLAPCVVLAFTCRGREVTVPRPAIAAGMLAAAFLVVLLFALGPHGPGDGLLFRAARKLVPPVAMMRQPARAFCLAPTLMTVIFAVGFACLAPRLSTRRLRLAAGLALFLITADYACQVDATVCLLDGRQPAYAAARDDAVRQGFDSPRVLIVPLWRGDADVGSLYQFHASSYRLRMVNGYSPVVSTDYFETIFRRFESANQGFLDGGQLDELLGRGVSHILVHEDQFPEKVSPFPVATTLCRLLNHPRLAFLEQAGSVWAFAIRGVPAAEQAVPACALQSFFPARSWEAEAMPHTGERMAIDDASGGAAVRLADAEATIASRPARTGPAVRLRWEMRVRGEGTLHVVAEHPGGTVEKELEVSSDTWTWRSVMLLEHEAFGPVSVQLDAAKGRIDVDAVYLGGGWWPEIQPGRPYRIPATAFFHAGAGNMNDGSVALRTRYEPHGQIWYGPNLPLAPGTYDVELMFSTDGGPGLRLGALAAGTGRGKPPVCEVTAGERATGVLEVADTRPVRLAFDYERTADMRLAELVLTRRTVSP